MWGAAPTVREGGREGRSESAVWGAAPTAKGPGTRCSRCSPSRCTCHPMPASCPHKTACTRTRRRTRCSRRSRPSCTGRPRVASLLHRSPGIVAGLQAVVGRSIRCNCRSHSRCRATPTGRSSSRRRDCTRHPPHELQQSKEERCPSGSAAQPASVGQRPTRTRSSVRLQKPKHPYGIIRHRAVLLLVQTGGRAEDGPPMAHDGLRECMSRYEVLFSVYVLLAYWEKRERGLCSLCL